MEIKEWNGSQNDLMRIIQESVPGKQITMAVSLGVWVRTPIAAFL